ncbi:hypothetical protein QMK19_35085 [Streptomyces sp. H10-C2]|uniref:hypothetical protein n=1 Tax=unclassified Streptomyces TaxID=2593676 RepID=UPI0024B969C4|nr:MULTISPECIES: hypothetical protein [unclassified Streptomyces]MDJ0345819.1 hypothetical protein [Streptomyces sp. PH10-H1]MDJ0374709.1 hypothetical protein [Streptomyces sp. H10-C2]
MRWSMVGGSFQKRRAAFGRLRRIRPARCCRRGGTGDRCGGHRRCPGGRPRAGPGLVVPGVAERDRALRAAQRQYVVSRGFPEPPEAYAPDYPALAGVLSAVGQYTSGPDTFEHGLEALLLGLTAMHESPAGQA